MKSRKPKFKRKKSLGAFGVLALFLSAVFAFSSMEDLKNPLKEYDEYDSWHPPQEENVTTSPTATPTPTGIPNPPDEFQVHILDVGQGLSVLIEAGAETLLYDGGDSDASSFVISYLQKEGIETLDYCIASHYDADHLSGIIGALHIFNVEALLAPDYVYDTKTYKSFMQTAEDAKLPIYHPSVGESFPLGEGCFEILGPIGTNYEDENDYSIVIKATIGESTLLLTGDATSLSEAEMLQAELNLDSDVLVLGHHGSYTSTGQDFFQAVSPDFSIISCAQNNDYGHPHTRVMNLLQENNAAIYRTDLQGTICFTMISEDIVFEQTPCEDYSTGDDVRYRNYSSRFNTK